MEEAIQTAQHRFSLDTYHCIYTLNGFNHNLQHALNAQLPSNKKPYNKVLVCLIYFEKVFEMETERFEKFLRKDFGHATPGLEFFRNGDQLKFRGHLTAWMDGIQDLQFIVTMDMGCLKRTTKKILKADDSRCESELDLIVPLILNAEARNDRVGKLIGL